MNIKNLFKKFLASGTHPGLDSGKRVAIQLTNFDALLSFLSILFYTIDSVSRKVYPLNIIHPICLLVVVLGFLLVKNRYYDLGRYTIVVNGWAIIFLTVDAYDKFVGFEYFYFTALAIPFIMFSLREHWKGIVISCISGILLLVQLKLGTGLILETQTPLEAERFTAMAIVILFMISVLAVARWQLDEARKDIEKQQAELIHSSNLIALGEISSGIAHEVNNPLQALTFQMAIVKREIHEGSFGEVEKRIDTIDTIIFRIARMVKGLKELSRDDSSDPMEQISIKEILEDILDVSTERLKKLEIDFQVVGDQNTSIFCHPVQLAQVIINLLNNSIDAIKTLEKKWIVIDISKTSSHLILSVVDSGQGILPAVAHKMMNPFFTTKKPSEGTGLGLSISKSIIEKNGGNFSYDSRSPNTKFTIEYPLS